jgi:D-serine deaminase-like pyridoxal phosphate-dependent protein
MVVDLDAFDANADDLLHRAGGSPIRVASKSVRVPDLLRRVLARDGFHGVLAYTLAEALWLEEQGISDDIVVAYPTVDRGALARLVASPSAAARITLMVDDGAHLDVVDSVRASHAVPSMPGCGWAVSTSAPSAPRSTTPMTWSRWPP